MAPLEYEDTSLHLWRQDDAMNATAFVGVVFELRQASTQWGESIRVVGGRAEMGGWAPEKSVGLSTDEENYPLWRSGEVRLRLCLEARGEKDQDQDIVVTYKYVRDRCKLGEGFAWETKVPDRQVRIPMTCAAGTVWVVSDAGWDIDAPPKLRLEQEQQVLPNYAPENTPEPEEAERSFNSQYLLLGSGPLAKGGFSSVWRCRPRAGGDSALEYAAKRICKTEMPHRGRRFLFGGGACVGEIQLHSSLHHPNIVQLMEVFDDTDYVSLVLEYCRGGDLLEIVLCNSPCAGHGLAESAAVAIMRQVLTALAFLHEQGIIHRDVKCENIFQVEARCSVKLEEATFKLGDFGLAAKIRPDEVLLEQVGSPSTSAPEVVHGIPYGKPADVWSAGATLYTAIAARRPFEATSYAQMVKNANKGHVSLEGGVWDQKSIFVRELLSGLMEPSAKHRPTAAAALRHPWFHQ